MLILFEIFLGSFALVPVVAQPFSGTPSVSWRKPEITTSRQQQIAIASGALKVAQGFLDPNTALYPDNGDISMPATLFYEMARLDELTDQNTYQGTLKTYFTIAQERPKTTNDGLYVFYA
ncbi:hypothetical protein VKT23_005969 [Stygiomarasmius scandens]|uniref:Uncharacterized protein n=1 Tax=Marasmiellus scandens TaxID=2682957 RepID=A0ABR1JS73_9AGAR